MTIISERETNKKIKIFRGQVLSIRKLNNGVSQVALLSRGADRVIL